MADPSEDTVPRAAIASRVKMISRVLNAHAGGLELTEVDRNGSVTVRFTGMCTGCPLRPISLHGLVKPALLGIDGVTAVVAAGGRTSVEAEERLYDAMHRFGSSCLLAAVEQAAELETQEVI